MGGKVLGLEPCLAKQAQATLEEINALIESLDDSWRQKILTNWRDHYWGEVTGDVDLVMGTLVKDPIYRFSGSRVIGPPKDVSTTAEVRAMYGGLVEMGYRPAGPIADLRFAFADWGLMMYGTHTTVLPGAAIHIQGLIVDPNAAYRITHYLMQSHPYERATGLMTGEIAFMSDPIDVARVER